MSAAKIRLHLGPSLAPGQAAVLSEGQANYLFNVMRLGPGDGLRVFDGATGEYQAVVEKAGKRAGILRVGDLLRPFAPPPDLWLLFAPLRKERTAFLVEKAVELGVARLCPVLTRFTQGERLRPDKLSAQIIEAAEQCEATHLPALAGALPLERALATFPPDRRLIWADETAARDGAVGGSMAGALRAAPPPPGGWAILVGPEGGFSPEEHSLLARHPGALPVTLGPRILRAETAALAALTVWQSVLGDWV